MKASGSVSQRNAKSVEPSKHTSRLTNRDFLTSKKISLVPSSAGSQGSSEEHEIDENQMKLLNNDLARTNAPLIDATVMSPM